MRKLFSLFAAVLVALVANAAVINITNETPDALRLALNEAATGDIIEMAAGTYVESNGDYIAFDGKEVIVRAAEGAEVLIQPQVPITIANGALAKFENIKFDASRLVELATWYEHLIYAADASANNRLIMEGCELYGFNLNKSAIYCSTANALDAVTLNNCYIHDCMKSILFVENTANAINVQVTNSTFANISTNTESYWAGVMDVRASGATLTVDHCTFYNVIPMNTDYSCVSKITLANGATSNCIFMLPTAQDNIRAMRGVTATNCITYNYLKDSGTGIHSSVTKNNCVQVDPLFVDAANGNFTLGEGSPALTMNDGQPIGDPRWAPAAAPALENGFYLAGTMNGWGAAEGYKFVGNPANPAEFMLETTLAVADEFKVINYLNGEITAWYPNEAGNYVVDAAHAGDVTIYFQPDYKADWAEFGGYFYVAVPEVPQPEMTAIYDWAGEIGTTIFGGNSNITTGTVKIHENTDNVNGIKFGSSYVYADGKYIAIKPAKGGFKAGDVLSVSVVFNNSDVTKYCMVDLRAADGDTRIWMSDSLSTLNGRNAGEPIVQTYTLAADQDSLLLGRYGNTGMFITLLKVERAGGETPVVLEAPDAAPAAPTYAAYQVHAVYSATYNADCNFGEWGSGTQYTQEEFGKKYVTTGLGYFGLEFTGMDCSTMEALHLDVWIAADASIRIVPIHGGPEVGVTAQLEGQKWNSIDIALSEFEGVTNWSNVYQIKIDNASNLTFWLNNIYFYTTQEKTVDLVDGYYLIGNINGWDIHNLTAEHLFAVNPANEAEYILHFTLAEGNEFKVVSVANNALVAWYPEGENNNYVVDFAHAGEKDIYFRPDYQGSADWHAGCIYVAADENVNPWETWFAIGDSWTQETTSYLDWDGENQKATVHINVDKYGQWRAQVKYHGPVAEEGKCYRVALKLKSNNAINDVTVKYQDNVEMIYVADAALEANVEYVFDQTAAGLPNGNGIMVLDFGFAHAGDIIEIYDVVIEETECPEPAEAKYYLVGTMTNWAVVAEDAYLFVANAENEGEFMLTYTLAENDEIKVVKVEAGQDNVWYPAGDNYVVDAAHAGAKTIYFRPDGQGGEGWHYGCIYIAPNSGEGINNTAVELQATKTIHNGMLLIIKGDKTYNVMGQIVK